MTIYLIRHGKTLGNTQHRYIGKTDEKLSDEYKNELQEFPKKVNIIYCSPLKRCIETANILFPNKELMIKDTLRECDFGDFEDKCADEMADDTSYRNWVNNDCHGQIPNGDNVEEFKNRCNSAFKKIVKDNLNNDNIAIVTHGGVIMSILEKYAVPKQNFYSYKLDNGKHITVEVKPAVDLTLEVKK